MLKAFIAQAILLFSAFAFAGGGMGGTYTEKAEDIMTCTGPNMTLRYHYTYQGFADYNGNNDYTEYFIMDVTTAGKTFVVKGDYNTFTSALYREQHFPGEAIQTGGIAYYDRTPSESLFAIADSHLVPGQGGTLTVTVSPGRGKPKVVLFSVQATDCQLSK